MKAIKQFIGIALIGITLMILVLLSMFSPYMNNLMFLITYWKEMIIGILVMMLGCYLAFD